MNAWPSLQTMINNGWILRFAEGCTRRSNSINPIYSSDIDIEDHIRECEEIYTRQNLTVIFKLTEACKPHDLDSYLDKKGYRCEAHTSVQLLELNTVEGNINEMTEISDKLEYDWENRFYYMNKTKIDHQSTHGKIIRNIIPLKCFAKIRNNDNEVIACGLGVLEGEYLGLFDIVTDEKHRRKSYGKILVENMIIWGKMNGAKTAYLQVMKNNEPALRLYSKLGFKEEYSYWYRVKQ